MHFEWPTILFLSHIFIKFYFSFMLCCNVARWLRVLLMANSSRLWVFQSNRSTACYVFMLNQAHIQWTHTKNDWLYWYGHGQWAHESSDSVSLLSHSLSMLAWRYIQSLHIIYTNTTNKKNSSLVYQCTIYKRITADNWLDQRVFYSYNMRVYFISQFVCIELWKIILSCYTL